MSILAVAFVLGAAFLALVVPWLGVLAYYLFSVMQMQYLWPQDFGEARVSLIITAATILGLGAATALKMVNWRVLLSPYAFMMLLLILWVNLSYEYSSFISYFEIEIALASEDIISTFNKTAVFFLIACLLINTREKLEACIYLLAFITLYYSAWANKMYLTGEFWRFGDNGRLGGPLESVYVVLATPVLYYLGVARQNFFLRYGIWLTIPFTWHALFLAGSRGGLLALGTVCIYIFFRSFHKLASIGIVIGLVLAIVFQSGHLLTRVDTTIEASEQLEQMDTEEKLDPRLISWGVALEIMQKYPVFGVGVGNYINAFPEFSNTKPHVAHNTFFQFSSQCGVLAGLIYLWFFIIRIPTLRRSAKIAGRDSFPCGYKRDYLDDLINSVYLGFFIVAIFLDLMIYEILYFVILIGFVKYTLDRQTAPKERRLIDSIYRYGQADRKAADDASGDDTENDADDPEEQPVSARPALGHRSRSIG